MTQSKFDYGIGGPNNKDVEPGPKLEDTAACRVRATSALEVSSLDAFLTSVHDKALKYADTLDPRRDESWLSEAQREIVHRLDAMARLAKDARMYLELRGKGARKG